MAADVRVEVAQLKYRCNCEAQLDHRPRYVPVSWPALAKTAMRISCDGLWLSVTTCPQRKHAGLPS